MCRAFDVLEPCSHLWCGHKNTSLVCKTKKGPPLEGTECGVNKVDFKIILRKFEILRCCYLVLY